jgi:hypothetical protein
MEAGVLGAIVPVDPRVLCSQMVGQVSGGSRYQALRHSQRVLERMAPIVRFGLFAVGVSVFLDQVGGLVSDAQFTWGERRVMGMVALITIGGFGLAGWVAGRLIKASADLIEVVIAGAESAGRTADLIELHVVPTLGRIAAALERARPAASALAGTGGPEEAPRAIDGLRAQLEAARRADDPERVIDCRDALTEHLRGEPLRDLDRQVVRWLVGRVQARARAGTAAGALAAASLAARVAESFGDTPEGASLRAALPSLRRDAGLCPRCARPNPADGDLCPRCAIAAPAPGAAPLPLSDAPESEDIP